MARKKLYYTQSEINTNLYATPGQFITADNTPYIGLYHTYTNTGEYYTGAVWNEKTSKPLTKAPANLDAQVIQYKSLKQIETKYLAPKAVNVTITTKNVKDGYITRYVLIKNNDNIVTEVDSDQYQQWQTKKIDNAIYTGFSVQWHITGEIQSVRKNGILFPGVIEKNTQIYNKLMQINSILANHFANPLQFYVDTNLNVPTDIN